MQPESRWDRPGVRRKIRAARRGYRNGERYEGTVVLRGSNRVIGRVALLELDAFHRRGEIAYWFDPATWGRGLATEAVHLVCDHAFREMRLNRIDAKTYAFNLSSMRLVRRLGFRREGVLRDAWYAWSGWQSDHRYGLLRGELRTPPHRSGTDLSQVD